MIEWWIVLQNVLTYMDDEVPREELMKPKQNNDDASEMKISLAPVSIAIEIRKIALLDHLSTPIPMMPGKYLAWNTSKIMCFIEWMQTTT